MASLELVEGNQPVLAGIGGRRLRDAMLEVRIEPSEERLLARFHEILKEVTKGPEHKHEVIDAVVDLFRPAELLQGTVQAVSDLKQEVE